MRADRTVAGLLRVQAAAPRESVAGEDSWPFETPLLISARCILRYAVLPFLLPVAGIAAAAATGLLLMLDAVAAVAIVSTLRRLWRMQHPGRWQYLAGALFLLALVAFFLLNDMAVL
jgi:hypothetical protein